MCAPKIHKRVQSVPVAQEVGGRGCRCGRRSTQPAALQVWVRAEWVGGSVHRGLHHVHMCTIELQIMQKEWTSTRTRRHGRVDANRIHF